MCPAEIYQADKPVVTLGDGQTLKATLPDGKTPVVIISRESGFVEGLDLKDKPSVAWFPTSYKEGMSLQLADGVIVKAT